MTGRISVDPLELAVALGMLNWNVLVEEEPDGTDISVDVAADSSDDAQDHEHE